MQQPSPNNTRGRDRIIRHIVQPLRSMLNRKVASRCAGAVVAATVLLSTAERAITRQERSTVIPRSSTSSLLPPPSSSGLEADHDDDGDSRAGCAAPYATVMPERRHRVEAPSEGSVAGNVRAVYEDMSAGILVRTATAAVPQQSSTSRMWLFLQQLLFCIGCLTGGCAPIPRPEPPNRFFLSLLVRGRWGFARRHRQLASGGAEAGSVS